jgi:hypothetical protein
VLFGFLVVSELILAFELFGTQFAVILAYNLFFTIVIIEDVGITVRTMLIFEVFLDFSEPFFLQLLCDYLHLLFL